MKIRLYTTLGCHLCEEAMSIVQLLDEQGMDILLEEIEISDSEPLIKCYGTKVPVIAREDNEEIDWPFSVNELYNFLNT